MIRDRLKHGATELLGEIERSRIILRVAKRTELTASLSARGLYAVARALADGGSNPALLYRIYAADRPDAPAIVCPGGSVTYAALYAEISRMAGAFEQRGVGQGESVLLVMKNRPEFIVAQNACALLGAAAVSASPHASAAELAHLASHARATLAVVEPELVDRVREAAPDLRLVVAEEPSSSSSSRVERWRDLLAEARAPRASKPAEDAAVVVYTSGTTGTPKGSVRKFPRETMPSTMLFIEATPMRAGDVHLVVAPLYHSTAYAFATMTHLLGGAVVLLDAFSPASFLGALDRFDVTTTALVPTMLHRVVEHLDGARRPRGSFPKLRAIFSGGAPLSSALAARVIDHFGDVLFNFYGATETGLVTLADSNDLRRAPGTIGRAVPGVDVRLVGDDGRPVREGDAGELYVRSALQSAGYLRDASATNAATLEGFFSVGDVARVDAEGRYFLVGRKRELVISGGVNVYPVEVEHALEEHPSVREAAVVGAPDEEWGERVVAFVVLEPETTPDAEALKAWMRAHVAAPKVPREIRFVEALPRNPTGKVLKSRLLETPQ